MALLNEFEALSQIKKANPQLSSFSDVELADMIERRRPGTFKETTNSSPLRRFAGRVEQGFSNIGERVGKFIGDKPAVGPDAVPIEGGMDFFRRSLGRAASMGIQSLPEMATQAGAVQLIGRGVPQTVAGLGLLGAGGVLQYERNRAAGATPGQSAGAGVSTVANLPLVIAGSALARRALGGKIGNRVATALGGIGGGTAADAIEIGTSADPMGFISDPINLAALGLSNVPDIALEVARPKPKPAPKLQLGKIKDLKEEVALSRLDYDTRPEDDPIQRYSIKEERPRVKVRYKGFSPPQFDTEAEFQAFGQRLTERFGKEKADQLLSAARGRHEFDLLEDIEGHPALSTLGLESIREAGFEPDVVEGVVPPDVRFSKKHTEWSNTVFEQLQRSVSTQPGALGPKFQLDEQGNVSGKGLLRAMTKWAPPDFMEHYKAQGIEKILDSNKVNFQEFTQWVEQNTPEIEVKKLQPRSIRDEAAVLQHELESRGYQASTNDRGEFVLRDLEGYVADVKDTAFPTDVAETFKRYTQVTRELDSDEPVTDAATGRYGVEPIKVSEMDRPVDILVRVPALAKGEPTRQLELRNKGRHRTPAEQVELEALNKKQDHPLYRGPHFGESDVNVVASIRGYFVGDTFFAFEVQSDWGQGIAKIKKSLLKPNLTLRERGHGMADLKRSTPFLNSYETLALKTAIRHAIENGATKIAIADPETAMMIEHHDQSTPDLHALSVAGGFQNAEFNTGEPFGPVFKTKEEARAWAKQQRIAPTQEKGMRQHYGRNLPDIAKKLTKDKGQVVSLGKFTMRDPSAYFGGKDTITARVFDLSQVDPDVLRRTFSIYDSKKQFDMTKELQPAIDEALARGKFHTAGELLDLLAEGQQVDKAILGKFLAAVGDPKQIQSFRLEQQPDSSFVAGFTQQQRVALNLANDWRSAFTTAAHEFSHVTMAEFRTNNPEAYKLIDDFVHSVDVDTRKAMLQQFFAAAKADARALRIDFDYLAGRGLDPNDPRSRSDATYEFVGGIVEALAADALNDAQSNTLKDYISWLPNGVQHFLAKLMQKIRRFFGKGYPSAQHYLDRVNSEKLQYGIDLLSKTVLRNEELQNRASRIIKRTDFYNQNIFAESLPMLGEPATLDQLKSFLKTQGSDDFKRYSKKFLETTGFLQKVENAYQKLFFGALMRTRLKPFTTDAFLALHHYRNHIRSQEHEHLAVLGQDDAHSRGLEEALVEWNKIEDRLTNPLNREGRGVLEKISKVIERDQQLRQKWQEKNPGLPMEASALVDEKTMQTEFGLKPEDAKLVTRFREMMTQVAKQTIQDMLETDTFNVSRLFFIQNKQQKLSDVEAKVRQFQAVADEAGKLRSEASYIVDEIKRLEGLGDKSSQEYVGLQNRRQQLAASDGQLKQAMELQIRQAFEGLIEFGEPGADTFINQVSEVMTRLAAIRAKTAFIMRDMGYAPMTRRGRFLVRVFRQKDGDPLEGSAAELHGFDSQSQAQQFVNKRGLPEGYFEIIDKNVLRERVKMYYPSQLRSVRDKARQEFQELIHKMRLESQDLDPDSRDTMLAVLQEIETSFRPLDEEIRDVVSDKGDKFKERRWNIPGFDRNDFIPNIFEYMNFRTVVGKKAITRAKVRYELSRPEFDDDPALADRMSREMDYVLTHAGEAVGMRRFIFNWYLGASVRHMFQNAMQVPMVGIPQMMSRGAGMKSYKYFADATQKVIRYQLSGSTGNKEFDALIQRAEKEGIVFPSAIEHFAPQVDEIQNALDRAAKFSKGDRVVGETLNHYKEKVGDVVGKVLRSTAVASEVANRKISFVMSLLENSEKGIKDTESLFKEANLFTDYVNFVGDKSNRPGFLVLSGQTPIHSPMLVLTALQTFTLNQIGQVYTFYKKGFNRKGINFKVADSAEAKAFATSLAHLMILSGTMGLLGVEMAEQLFEKLTGISLRTAIRKKLVEGSDFLFGASEETGGRIADGILSGLPSMLGVDASASLGLGSPFFRFQAGHEMAATDIIGPLGGIIQRAGDAVKAIEANPWNPKEFFNSITNVARAASPQALNYFVRMNDAVSKDAFLNRRGQPVIQGLEFDDYAALALGYTPQEATKRRQIDNFLYKEDQRDNAVYGAFADKIAQLLHKYETTGDPEDLEIARSSFRDYIERMGGNQRRDTFVDSVAERLSAFRNPTMQPPSLKQGEAHQYISSAYPEVEFPYQARRQSLADELRTSAFLGQRDVLARKIAGLQQRLRSSALYDSLVQAGLPPEIAALISRNDRQAASQLRERQLLQGPSVLGNQESR